MTIPDPKTFQVKSFGCQMNVYDGERMAEMLEAEGMTAAADGAEADLVVLNTCHIREKAAEKVYSGHRPADEARPRADDRGRRLRRPGRGRGDLAPRARRRHRRRPAGLSQSARAGAQGGAGRARARHRHALALQVRRASGARRQGPSAFLTVQEGCDKFCTYCVVPYTRGAEISRPFAAILDEAKALIDAGAKEIILLGQNVNAWRDGEGRGLDALIRALDALPGLARIRYTTSHPTDMTDGLIRAHAEVEKLMPYLHLPVQSGSDRMLKAMNRSHSAESYLRILDRSAPRAPTSPSSGDFIVGFPGETDAEFDATLNIVEAVNYAQAFSFKYSPRPGTPAADMEDQIPADVMDERLQRLQALLNAQQLAFNQAKVGRRTEVLLERPGRKPGQQVGKSPWLQSVHLETDAAIGDIVEVELLSAGPNSLAGAALMRTAA